ncbi:MAG: MarR family transcriptional regulator [Myxococcota bacterium]
MTSLLLTDAAATARGQWVVGFSLPRSSNDARLDMYVGMEHRLHVLLERLSNVLREDLRTVATAHDLKLVQLDALQYLVVANRFSDTLTALVAFLGSTKGTASQTVKALERKGLLVRSQDPDDGRVFHLELTEEGRRIAERALPAPALSDIEAPDTHADNIEALLQQMLAARGGARFGVCHTCRHHDRRGDQRWCALLKTELHESEVSKWCTEHEPAE